MAVVVVLALIVIVGEVRTGDATGARGVLRARHEPVTAVRVAVSDLRAPPTMLWETPVEAGRTVLLPGLACVGGAARARIAGGTDVRSGLAGLGRGAELLAQERIVSEQAAAALREPLHPDRCCCGVPTPPSSPPPRN
ncbi:hypothetical protein ACPCAC_13390 [Streptomyces lavendulocolor]|uniref:hypothetical protein n=1 Tax=Streptomyces lavendulocolor TaxID=67316 RepID=UPI003C2AD22F